MLSNISLRFYDTDINLFTEYIFNKAFEISINSNCNQIERKLYDGFVKNKYYDKKTQST